MLHVSLLNSNVGTAYPMRIAESSEARIELKIQPIYIELKSLGAESCRVRKLKLSMTMTCQWTKLKYVAVNIVCSGESLQGQEAENVNDISINVLLKQLSTLSAHEESLQGWEAGTVNDIVCPPGFFGLPSLRRTDHS